MKILLSVSSTLIEDKTKKSAFWCTKNAGYSVVLRKLLRKGGEYVDFPINGEPFLAHLVAKGKLFEADLDRLGKATSLPEIKEFCTSFVEEDIERYDLCVGYCLVLDGEIDSWIPHVWVLDKQTKQVLESSTRKVFNYFGCAIEKSDWILLEEKQSKPITSVKPADLPVKKAPEQAKQPKSPTNTKDKPKKKVSAKPAKKKKGK